MSSYRKDEIPFLCSKGYDPILNSPQKFKSAWDLLVNTREDIQKQVEEKEKRLQTLKKENNQCEYGTLALHTLRSDNMVASTAPSISSTNPYELLSRPASSNPSPITAPKTSLNRMLDEPQFRKDPVDSLVREIQGRQDELKRVQHDIETEEGRKLKKSHAAADKSEN